MLYRRTAAGHRDERQVADARSPVVLECHTDLFRPLWTASGLAAEAASTTARSRVVQHLLAQHVGTHEAAVQHARRNQWIDQDGKAALWLADALRLIAHAPVEAETVVAPREGGQVRALVSVSGRQVLRTTLRDRVVRIERVPSRSGYGTLFEVWPGITPGTGDTVSTRVDDAYAAGRAAADLPRQAAVRAMVRELRSRGYRDDQARDFVRTLVADRLCDGRFSLAVRDVQGRVRWRDTVAVLTITATGAYAQFVHGNFLVDAPADAELIERALVEASEQPHPTPDAWPHPLAEMHRARGTP